MPSRLERFMAKVQRDGCWWWTGARSSGGYGNFWNGERTVGAHRFAYEAFIGSIPNGHELDHVLCNNGPRGCVNPLHVEPVPYVGRLNTVRHHMGRTHCKHGHEFTPDNTYVDGAGHRSCKACRRAALVKFEARNPSRAHREVAS